MKIVLLLLVCVLFAFDSNSQSNDSISNVDTMETIYQFTVKDINGDDFAFKNLEGKKILVVNTASKCGFTPQYEGLQNLYEKYREQNFAIVAFPANNFLAQEPGTDKEIAEFCRKEYHITFPIMSKISVKGKKIHPVYQFLTEESRNAHSDSKVSWNFQKYLIDENGRVVGTLSPKTDPMAEEIVNWITK